MGTQWILSIYCVSRVLLNTGGWWWWDRLWALVEFTFYWGNIKTGQWHKQCHLQPEKRKTVGKKRGEVNASSWGSHLSGAGGRGGVRRGLGAESWETDTAFGGQGEVISGQRGLEAGRLWYSWVYYPKGSIDSMQSLSSYQWYFSEN